MDSPQQLQRNVPIHIDEFIHVLLQWISTKNWNNVASVRDYLLKIYHSFVYVLTLHRINWRKVKSFRYRRDGATRVEDELLAIQPEFVDAFRGEFLGQQKPQPPAHYVVKMFEEICAERQRETQLLRFFGGISSENCFKPAVLSKADYSQQYGHHIHHIHTKGVNVACDRGVRQKFIQNMRDHVFHPQIRDQSARSSRRPHRNGLRTMSFRWENVNCRSVLVPRRRTGRSKPRPPCRTCYTAFPTVNWRPKSMNRQGRDYFPFGNCAEICAISKLLVEAQVPGSPSNPIHEDDMFRQSHEFLKNKFATYLIEHN